MEIIKTIKQVPVLRLLLPIIVGIILGDTCSCNSKLVFAFAFFFLSTSLLFGFVPYFSKRIRLQKFYGMSVTLFLISIGVLLICQKNQNHFLDSDLTLKKDTYLVEVAEVPREKKKAFQVKAQFLAKIDTPQYHKINKGIILYLSKEDSLIQGLVPGDQMVITTRLQEIKNRNNPYEFDYKSFANRRGYYYTAYLNTDDFLIWEGTKPTNLKTKIADLRLSILNKLRKEFKDQHFALLSSMLIGIKDDLDEETRYSFSASGLTHLLAISGLHVGILYLALSFMLSFMGNALLVKLARNTVIMLVIWLYAVLAGLSPSVTRAAIMFTVIIIGNMLERKSAIYNSLAFAAFLMLAINPYNLFEVGFQLSFIAVLGIVYFQPKIYGLWPAKNKLLSTIWGLVSVSIAAQIATFPLTIYYFHQFPNYFILSNLLAIPLAFLVLISGLAYITIGWIPVLGSILSFSTSLFADLMLRVSILVSEFPFSVSEGLSLSRLQVIFVFLFFVYVAFFLAFKRSKFLVGSLISLLVAFFIGFINLMQIKSKKEFTIYNNQDNLISYIDGFHAYCFADSINKQNRNYEYAFKEHLIKQRVYNNRIIADINTGYQYSNLYIHNFHGDNNLIVFGKEKFLFLNKKINGGKEKIKVDYIVLGNNIKASIENLNDKFDFRKVIFAASNSFWHISEWVNECKLLGIEYFSIPDNGAFQIEIKKKDYPVF